MKKCTLGEDLVNTLVNTFLPLVNTMNTLRIKYYLFLKKKRGLKDYITTKKEVVTQSLCLKVFIVFTHPVKCSLKSSLSVHPAFTFGGFYVK